MTDTPPDPLLLAGAKAKGKRPFFFENPDTERVMNITLALMQEVAVMRERLDTVERLLERDGSVTRAAIEAYEPNREEAAERGLLMQEFIARCLRILQQDREALARQGEQSSEDVADEFARGD
jgi:hypothetical protein